MHFNEIIFILGEHLKRTRITFQLMFIMNRRIKRLQGKKIHSVFSPSTCMNSFTFIYLFPVAIIIIIIIYEQKDNSMTETKAWLNNFHTSTHKFAFLKCGNKFMSRQNMKTINVLNDMKIVCWVKINKKTV